MIYAELSGGLGNQMFVYAFARAMGLCCHEPVTLIDRQDWKTGSPAHTALALQALHISSEVQFITDAGFAKQHLPVQNAAKALMIRHEQRVGLMDRDWHPFEARMAPMLNAIGLHFATEGFTPAKRGHAKNFLAWGYFQGADYFKDQAETIRAELLPIENPEHGFTAADLALMRRCRAFVLSNSTFSWWGQWLAGVPGRCVIAPDRWYANGKKTALYDHDWTLIPTK